MAMLMPIWSFIIISETILRMECAPKLGPLLFDPISYESEKFQKVLNELIPIALSKMNKNISEDGPIRPSTVLETRTIREGESTINPTTILQTQTTADTFLKLSAIIKMFENSKDTDKLLKLSKFLRYGGSMNTDYYYDNNKCRIINDRILCGYEKNKGVIFQDEIIELGNGCRLRNYRFECGYLTPPYNDLRRPPSKDNQEPQNSQAAKLKLRASFPLDVDYATNLYSGPDFSSNNAVEATPPDTESNILSTAPRNKQRMLQVKLKIPVEKLSNFPPKMDASQRSRVFTTEFMIPSKRTIESLQKIIKPVQMKVIKPEHIKIMKEGEINFLLQETSPIPVSIQSLPIAAEMPTVIESLVPTQVTPEVLSKSTEITTSQKLTTELKIETESTLALNTTEKVISTTKIPVPSSVVQRQETDPTMPTKATTDGKDLSARKNPRVLRSVDVAETPKIIDTQQVTKKRRWCVEKGDRIVCYYSKNY